MSVRATFLVIAAALLGLFTGILYVMTRASLPSATARSRVRSTTGASTGTSSRTGEEPEGTGEAVALETLMKRAEFSDAEFAMLRRAKVNSDELVALEDRAMAAMKGLYADAEGRYTVRGPPDPELARRLMHGEAYHRAKGSIMEPIDSFLGMVEQRTTSEMQALRDRSRRLARTALGLMGVAVGLVVLAIAGLQRRVVRPVTELADAAGAVESGDYSRRLPLRRLDEVGRLTRAFNLMSAGIERDIDERERTAPSLPRCARRPRRPIAPRAPSWPT